MRNAKPQPAPGRVAGFTLIEILVVILILSSLMVWLLPNIVGGQQAANEFGCQTNLKNLYENITIYKQRHRQMPGGGGPQMLWNIWRSVEKTERNRDLFFCPEVAAVDDYLISEIRKIPLDDLWRNAEDFTSRDTHYACRSKRYYKSMNSGREAWIADDNEDGPNHPSGAINVLYGDGTVRGIQKQTLEDMGLWGGSGDSEENYVFPVGPESPHKDLQKLDVGVRQ